MKLKSKLITSMLIAALIPLALSIGMQLRESIHHTQKQAIDSASSELRSMADKLSAHFDKHISTINTYTRTPVIRNFPNQEFMPFLKKEIVHHNKVFEKFLIGRLDGQYFYTSGGNPYLGGVASFNDNSRSSLAKSIKKRDYWLYTVGDNHQHLQRSYVSNPMISYTTGAKQIVIATSILDKQEKVSGMLGGSLPWHNIEQHITQLRKELETRLPWDTRLFLISPEGIYWYHWDLDKVVHLNVDKRGRPVLNELGEKASIRSKITNETNPQLAKIGQRMMNGEEGYELITNIETNETDAIFYAPVRSAGYSVGIRVPYQQVNAPVIHMIMYQGGISLIAILIIIVTALFLSRRISSPIVQLRDAADELSHGKSDNDWEHKLITTGEDEVSDLTKAFHSMIASLKERELSLAKSKERFTLAMKGSNDGLWDWDIKTNEIYYSPSWVSMLGYAENEIIHNIDNFDSRVHPDDLSKVKKHIQDYLNGQIDQYRIELRMRHKDGHYIDILSQGFALRDNNNQPTRFVGTHTDISKRKQGEAALIAARNEAQQADKAKSQFLSNMSHELRTPLNAIIGFAEILSYDQQGHLSDNEKRNLEEISSAGWHLLEIINDILDLSKIEVGKLRVKLSPIELDQALNESESVVKSMAKEKQISISREQNCNDFYVETDKLRLKQVLLNLLTNAIKYNHPGGSVVISCEQLEHNLLRVNITDTGNGIADEQLRDVFEPFNRLDSDHCIDGTGVGLTISQHLIKLMGGDIGVRSEIGIGSTFWITLQLSNSPIDSAEKTNSDEDFTNLQHVEKNKYSILCVEDNPANMLLMKEIFSDFELLEAPTGEKGIELAFKHKPDLILMDINLPGINGTEAMQQIRVNNETKNIPVIALSGNALQSDIDYALNLGFDDYLTKPLNIKSLIKKAQQHLNLDPQA